LFGTTNAGRDLFSLIWVATRTSLLIGLIVAGINISIGVVYGSISGYYGGNIDIIMQRFSEIVGRIPFLVILAIFIALLGAGIQTLIFILIISGWIGVAYVTRTQFYRFKGREYVLASRTLGAKDMRLIFRHILPNGIGTIITASILLIPATIFTESTISYLGFGIGHGTSFNILGLEFSGVSVGVLLADGRQELITRPYLTVYPAIVISILMITFNMFGNALRDALNPSLRGSL
jgi:ABC-type dipeptide/oligopeptide/nickel transport system permease subunit